MQKMDRFLRIKEACQKLGVGNTTLYELVKTGKLKRPFKVAPNCSGFMESYLDGYIDQCAEVSRPERRK